MQRLMSVGLVLAGLLGTAVGCTANVEKPTVDQTGRKADSDCVTTCDNSKTTCVGKCTDDSCKGSCETTYDDCTKSCESD
jgi:hypothetical protein